MDTVFLIAGLRRRSSRSCMLLLMPRVELRATSASVAARAQAGGAAAAPGHDARPGGSRA